MAKHQNQNRQTEPPKSGEASSINDQSNPGAEDMLKTVLEDFGARVECNNQQQGIRIAENARAISEISDLMSGLSLQLNQLMADKIKRGNPEDVNNNLGTKSTSNPPHQSPNLKLGELIGNPHQYSSRLMKIEFPRFGGDELGLVI